MGPDLWVTSLTNTPLTAAVCASGGNDGLSEFSFLPFLTQLLQTPPGPHAGALPCLVE